METHSHTMLVAGAVAVLIAALIAFIMWITPDAGKHSRRYDILFERSVAGLAEGSPINYAGIVVGRVEKVGFDHQNPKMVRVRVVILDPDAPILKGTIAALSRNPFGQALIKLDGAVAGAPPILAARQGELPIIPAKKGGFLDDPVALVENITATTNRLNEMLSPEGQRKITQQIDQLEEKTGALAGQAPHMADKLAAMRKGIRSGSDAATKLGSQAAAMDAKLQATGPAKVAELRASIRAARDGLQRLDARVQAAQPAVQALAKPALREKLQELHSSVAAVRESVGQVERSGMGPLMSKPKLPDYKPK